MTHTYTWDEAHEFWKCSCGMLGTEGAQCPMVPIEHPEPKSTVC